MTNFIKLAAFVFTLLFAVTLDAEAQTKKVRKAKVKAVPTAELIKQGRAAYDAGNYAEAATLYTQALKKLPRSADLYKERGNAALRQNQFDAAIADYEKAMKFRKDYVKAYFNRGLANYGKGNAEFAVRDMTQAIALAERPQAPVKTAKKSSKKAAVIDEKPFKLNEAYYGRGLANAKLGVSEKAVVDFTKAIDLKPDYADAYEGRAGVYYNGANYKAAESDYKKLGELNPNSQTAKTYLTWIQQTAGK